MKKIVITCGLISGSIISAVMGIGMYIGRNNPNPDYDNSEILGYTTMILVFSLIFVGIKMFRDKYNGGAVSFGKAFLIGLYIALIASTMYVAVWAIEYHYVFHDYMDQYAAHMVEHAKSQGLSQDKLDAKIKEMAMYRDMYKNPLFFTLLTYVEILPVGIVISLIAALILKRRKINPVIAN